MYSARAAVEARARGGVGHHVCDLATGAGREDLVEWVGKPTDALDLLCRNAGIQSPTRIEPGLDPGAVAAGGGGRPGMGGLPPGPLG